MPHQVYAHAAVASLPEALRTLHTHVDAVLHVRIQSANKAECTWFSIYGDGKDFTQHAELLSNTGPVKDLLYEVRDSLAVTLLPSFLLRRLPVVHLGGGKYLKLIRNSASTKRRLRQAWRSDVYQN